MKTSKAKFPMTVSENGVSAKIKRVTQIKNGKRYTVYVADFHVLGKRKQVGRSSFEDAKTIALDACRKTANGGHVALTLNNAQAESYLRGCDALKGLSVPVDVACQEYSSAVGILAGRASIAEACRDWIKRNAVELPKISLSEAAEQLKQQAKIDRKSKRRLTQLSAPLGKFCDDLQMQVHQITPDIVSRWLAGLPPAERTRRNYRDVLSYFCRFCVRRGYLAKGTDWLENVQQYRARKIGEIATYEPKEMRMLLTYAAKNHRRMVPFLAIGAFAGLRHSERRTGCSSEKPTRETAAPSSTPLSNPAGAGALIPLLTSKTFSHDCLT